MKKVVVGLLIFSLFLQIGCSGITQISLPVEQSKSENEIRQLNYFGERLSSTIFLADLAEIKASHITLKENKIYFLSNNPNDPPFLDVEKVKSIMFYDLWRGCLFGGVDGILLGGIMGMAGPNYVMPLIGFSLGMAYGLYALGDREFVFIQNKSVRD